MLVLTLAMLGAVDVAERALPVGSFHAVDVVAKATVKVEQAAVTSVVATGDPALVRCVTADVRDGRLVIGWAGRGSAGSRSTATGEEIVVRARADCRREGDPQRLVVRVSAPAIDAVSIGEQGIVLVSPLRVPAFAASITGRGTIAIDRLSAGTTRLSIAGGGRIVATGALGRLGVSVAGLGVIDTRAAHADALDVSVGGHGDIVATVDGPASGTLAGLGTIAIGGRPVCAIRKLGGGRIVCPATS